MRASGVEGVNGEARQVSKFQSFKVSRLDCLGVAVRACLVEVDFLTAKNAKVPRRARRRTASGELIVSHVGAQNARTLRRASLAQGKLWGTVGLIAEAAEVR
jgi:hypothetical protein